MVLSPLSQPCNHVATSEEQRRDPAYQACGALPGEACRWARRYDGVTVPPFHADRLEAAALGTAQTSAEPDKFRELILGTGLV